MDQEENRENGVMEREGNCSVDDNAEPSVVGNLVTNYKNGLDLVEMVLSYRMCVAGSV